MGDWQTWIVSTVLPLMSWKEARSSEQLTWPSQDYSEIAGSMAAILMLIIALAAYWAGVSSNQGLVPRSMKSHEENEQWPNADQRKPSCRYSSDTDKDLGSSRAHTTQSAFVSMNNQFQAGRSKSKTYKSSKENKGNTPLRHAGRDLCAQHMTKSTNTITSFKLNLLTMQTQQNSTKPDKNHNDTGTSSESKQNIVKVWREKNGMLKVPNSFIEEINSTMSSPHCISKASFTSDSPTVLKKSDTNLDLGARETSNIKSCSKSTSSPSKSAAEQIETLEKLVNIQKLNSAVISLSPTWYNKRSEGVKRKRALHEDDSEQESSRDDDIRFSPVGRSLSRPVATLKFRHPRLNKTRGFCWSLNARHYRSKLQPKATSSLKSFPLFDLGAGKKSFCVKREDIVFHRQTNIAFTPTQSPQQAVIQLSPAKLLRSKHCGSKPKIHLHGTHGTDMMKEKSKDFKDQQRYCKADIPKNYLEDFRYDKSQSNKLNESREEIWGRWRKRNTVRKDISFKCMVSLSDDANSECSENLTLTKFSSQHRKPKFTTKILQRNQPNMDKEYPPKRHSSPPFENRQKLVGNIVSSSASPGESPRKFALKSELSRSGRNRNLGSHYNHQSDPSTFNPAITGDSPDTLANLDILKAPVVCHVNHRPKPVALTTPPSVSLDSRQLVCLYKLALKKVGVGFRMSPVSPSAAHNLQRYREGTNQAHCHSKHNRSYHHHRSPWKHHHHSRPDKKTFRSNLNLNDSGDDEDNRDQQTHTRCHQNSSRASTYKFHSPMTRRVGRFRGESLYAFTSECSSPKARQASPGHTKSSSPEYRKGWVSRSLSPHDKKYFSSRSLSLKNTKALISRSPSAELKKGLISRSPSRKITKVLISRSPSRKPKKGLVLRSPSRENSKSLFSRSPSRKNTKRLISQSLSPQNRKLLHCADNPSSPSSHLLNMPKNNRSAASNYQFISTSPRKIIEREHKTRENKKKTEQQISSHKTKQSILNIKRKYKDNTEISPKKRRVKPSPHSNERFQNKSIKPDKIDVGKSGEGEKAFLHEKVVSTIRPRGMKEVKKKREVNESTLGRLEDVVEKLTNVLECTKSPIIRRRLNKQKSLTKKKKQNITTNALDLKSSKEHSVGPAHLTSIFHKSCCSSRHSRNHADTLAAGQSPYKTKYTKRTLPSKFLMAGTDQSQITNIAPPQASKLPSNPRKSKKFLRNQGISKSPQCLHRCGPPQLRTAARAAAKTSVVQTKYFKSKEPVEMTLTKSEKKRLKSIPTEENQTRAKHDISHQLKPNLSAGIHRPSLDKKHTQSSNLYNTEKTTRHSPKKYYVNLFSDPYQSASSMAVRPFHKKDHRFFQFRESHARSTSSQNFLYDKEVEDTSRSTPSQNLRYDRKVEGKFRASPIQKILYDRQAGGNFRTSPSQSILCGRQTGGRSILSGRSSVPSVSRSVSVDTSWDVSARQVFD